MNCSFHVALSKNRKWMAIWCLAGNRKSYIYYIVDQVSMDFLFGFKCTCLGHCSVAVPSCILWRLMNILVLAILLSSIVSSQFSACSYVDFSFALLLNFLFSSSQSGTVCISKSSWPRLDILSLLVAYISFKFAVNQSMQYTSSRRWKRYRRRIFYRYASNLTG